MVVMAGDVDCINGKVGTRSKNFIGKTVTVPGAETS